MARDTSNLKPFAKGYDPRRSVGAASAGRKFTASLNELAREDGEGNCVYTVEALKKIIKDPKSPHPRVWAAQEILRCRKTTYDTIGRTPQAANSLDRVADRTEGKPRQTVTIEHENTAGQLEQAQARLETLLLDPRLPEAIELIKAKRAEQPELPETVPTEAKALPVSTQVADIEPILLHPTAPPGPRPEMPPVPSHWPGYVPPQGAA